MSFYSLYGLQNLAIESWFYEWSNLSVNESWFYEWSNLSVNESFSYRILILRVIESFSYQIFQLSNIDFTSDRILIFRVIESWFYEWSNLDFTSDRIFDLRVTSKREVRSQNRQSWSPEGVLWSRYRRIDRSGLSSVDRSCGVLCLVTVNALLYKLVWPCPLPLLRRITAKGLTMSVNSTQVITFTVTDHM